MGNIIVALSVTVLAVPPLLMRDETRFDVEFAVTNNITAEPDCSCMEEYESGQYKTCRGSITDMAVFWKHPANTFLSSIAWPGQPVTGIVCDHFMRETNEAGLYIRKGTQSAYVPSSMCSQASNCSIAACFFSMLLEPEQANQVVLVLSFVRETIDGEDEETLEPRGNPSLQISFAVVPVSDSSDDCQTFQEKGNEDNMGSVSIQVACDNSQMELYDLDMTFQKCGECPSDEAEVCEECPQGYIPISSDASSGRCVVAQPEDSDEDGEESSSEEESSSAEDGDGGSAAQKLTPLSVISYLSPE
ncbi:hypothetical protein QOT17_006361 [Balamuthia mandrillaris]